LDNENKDIDQILFSQLNDASMDADGIDWDSFNKKPKRKRFVLWFFALFGLVSLAGVFLLFNNYSNNNKQNLPLSNSLSQSNTSTTSSSLDTLNKNKTANNFAQNSVVSTTGLSKATKMMDPKIAEELQEINAAKVYLNSSISKIEETIEPANSFSMRPKDLFEIFNFIKPQYTTVLVPQISIAYPYFIPKKKKTYWEIQAGPSVNIPNFKVLASGKSFIHKDYEGIRKISEAAESGYNLQLNLGKSVNRWSYGIGLGISSFNINGNYNFNYSEKPFIDLDGKIINYLQSSAVNIQFESKHKLSFIEVPVNIQYLFIDKAKFGLGLRFGFFNQFLTSIHGQLPNAVFLDEQEKMSTENFKIRTSAWQTGLQFHYKINPNTSLILMPEYRMGMGFNQVQNHYKTNYSYWGLNLNYRKNL
jgi:hypothetical protein